MRGCTVYCSPSVRGESFGMVLLEAMASGCALVASDLDGHRNVASDGVDALLTPVGDAAALAKALRRVLDDAGLRAELVAGGRRRAEQLSMARLAERYDEIYRRLVPRGSEPRRSLGSRRHQLTGACSDRRLDHRDPRGPRASATPSSRTTGWSSMRNRIENAWAQIDVQLKRRYDLIPNLVETVKGYASHERETLEAVVQARNMAMSAQGPQDQAAAENMITGALKSVFALSEAYPDLKANENFLNLQEELTGTEGRIAYARQFYNDSVYRYNTKIQSVPSNVIANQFSFDEREYFEVDEASRGNVEVDFGTAPAVDLGGTAAAPGGRRRAAGHAARSPHRLTDVSDPRGP